MSLDARFSENRHSYRPLTEIASERDVAEMVLPITSSEDYRQELLQAIQQLPRLNPEAFYLHEILDFNSEKHVLPASQLAELEELHGEKVTPEVLTDFLMGKAGQHWSEIEKLKRNSAKLGFKIAETRRRIAETNENLTPEGISSDSTLELDVLRLQIGNYRARENFSLRVIFDNNVYLTEKFDASPQLVYESQINPRHSAIRDTIFSTVLSANQQRGQQTQPDRFPAGPF